MKVLVTPRPNAVELIPRLGARVALARLFRTRFAARAQRREAQMRDRIHHAEPAQSTNASFWILHAR
ncbi:MAG TPA: hypothetical protein VE591_08700 [Candidatus Acidoferrum sp.]|nr:hypothetical protein [Candidatus Acidoferrum sp.]